MISALAVCGRPAADVGALKSRSKRLDPVGAGGAAPAVACGWGAEAVGCVVRAGGAVVIGGGMSSDPNRSTTGAGAAGDGLGACVRDNNGCVRDGAAAGAGAGAEDVGVGRVEVSTGGCIYVSSVRRRSDRVRWTYCQSSPCSCFESPGVRRWWSVHCPSPTLVF